MEQSEETKPHRIIKTYNVSNPYGRKLKEKKFRKGTIKKPITAEDYRGKPCLLSSYERLKRWKVNNPNHWYTLGLERPKND